VIGDQKSEDTAELRKYSGAGAQRATSNAEVSMHRKRLMMRAMFAVNVATGRESD
jgi:hypothetical protein